MTPLTAGIVGLILLFVFVFSGMHVGLSMAFLAVLGSAYLISPVASLSILVRDAFETASNYNLTVIPLFVLMGEFAFGSGISRRLFRAANAVVGRLPGGLAIATVMACGGFAAVCGSSPATAATIGAVALPEMRRYNYKPGLATGCIAGGGGLGILIPPSVGFLIYGIITEQSIVKLFAAGILPGFLLVLLFSLTIYVWVKIDKTAAPRGSKTSIKEKALAVGGGVGDIIILFVLIMGGLFAGFFSPTEAGAIGASGTLLLSLIRKRMPWDKFVNALAGTVRITAMLYLVIIGAVIFGRFLAVTGLPENLATCIKGLPVPPICIVVLILCFLVFLGTILDVLAITLITLPIFFPVIKALNLDPIWFGVLFTVTMEMSLITPPVGLNVFVIYGVARDVPLNVIFKGILPFVLTMAVFLAIIIAFPQVSLLLPGLLGK